MGTYLLDTNTVTYIVTSRSQAARSRYENPLAGDRVAISAITEGEIQYGLAARPVGSRSFEFIQRFLGTVESLPWDSDVSAAYGDLRSKLTSSGKPLGALDMLIAAHAIAVGAVLVTHDQAFLRLDPTLLRVENWAGDL